MSIRRIIGQSKLTSTVTQISVGTTEEQILAGNEDRKGFLIQNTGTTVIKLAFNPNVPTQTVYNVAIRAGNVADDGIGATYSDDMYTGTVRAISSVAGGTIVVTEYL